MKNIPQKYFTTNFQVHQVGSLSQGDPGDVLKTNFSGAIGITYY